MENEKIDATPQFIICLLVGYLSFNTVVLAVLWLAVHSLGVSKTLLLISGLSGTVGVILLIGAAMIYNSSKAPAQLARRRLAVAVVTGALLIAFPAVALLYHGGWLWYVWTVIGIATGFVCAAAVGQMVAGKRNIVPCLAMDAVAVILAVMVLYLFLAKAHFGSGSIACVLCFAETFLITLPFYGVRKDILAAECKGMNAEAAGEQIKRGSAGGEGFLFQYAVSVISGWVVNSLVIWIDYLLLVGFLGRHGYYYGEYEFISAFSGGSYAFSYLAGLVALGGGLFLLRVEPDNKRVRWGKGILGIVLAVVLAGELTVLLMHNVILGIAFVVSLFSALLLGFCVHSAKAWVHLIYYVAAVFLNAGCTVYIHLELVKGHMAYGGLTDSIAVIVPFTVLLPLISFGRWKCCKVLSDRNTHAGKEQIGSAYLAGEVATQSEQPVNSEDTSSFVYALLGFFIPVVGLTLYLVWRDTLPRRAKSAGKGALTAVILYAAFVVIYVLYVVIVVMRFSQSFSW